jgi:hypothetical protein
VKRIDWVFIERSGAAKRLISVIEDHGRMNPDEAISKMAVNFKCLGMPRTKNWMVRAHALKNSVPAGIGSAPRVLPGTTVQSFFLKEIRSRILNAAY